MGYQLINSEGLKREYKITVASDEIELANSKRFEELRGQASLPGFRPGKVPLNYISQRFGESITAETIDQLMNQEIMDLVKADDLKIASKPKIEVKEYNKGFDLECEFACEVFPDFNVEDLEFAKLKLTDYQIDISDSDVEDMLIKAARSKKEKKTYEDAKHKVKKGDFIKLNYNGFVDGEEFEGGKAEGAELEIGSERMIPGFEDKIIGMTKDSKKKIKVKFPKKYHASNLQGKDAEFEIEILDIQYVDEVKLDEDLAKELGAKNLEECKKQAKEALEQDISGQVDNKQREELFDYIEDKINIDLPESLVTQEIDQLKQKYLNDHGFKTEQEAEENIKKQFKKDSKEHEKLAKRRVKVGIILSEISKHENISVTQEEAFAKFAQDITQYPPEMQQNLISYYQSNPEAMEHLKAPIIEDKVVKHLKDKGALKEKKLTIDQFKKLLQG